MKLFWTITLLFFAACTTSNYRGQNRVSIDTVKFPGGVWKDKEWDETLTFQRTSFYVGAKLYYDVLAVELEEGSPFRNWLGDEKDLVKECSHLYVIMLYKDVRRGISRSAFMGQVDNEKRDVVLLPSFERNIHEHFVSDELHFLGHRVRGLCHRGLGSTDDMVVFLPGFKETSILKH